MKQKIKGNIGEDIAKSYLEDNGYKILELQFHSYYGEVDIIAKKNNRILFTEVKYYKENSLVDPISVITKKKQKRILKTAQYYITKANLEDFEFRFDLITIKNNAIDHHIKNMILVSE